MKLYQTFKFTDMSSNLKDTFREYFDDRFANDILIKVYVDGYLDDEEDYETIKPVYDWLIANGATDNCVLVDISW